MAADRPKFTAHHATQYTALSNDMRFYADQRFKIVTVFLVTSGLLANVVKDHPSVILCLLGAALAFLCLSWDLDTQRWWGTIITQCQALEDIAVESGDMILGYKRYRDQIKPTRLQELPHLRPSHAVAAIYLLGGVAWLAFAVNSCCSGSSLL